MYSFTLTWKNVSIHIGKYNPVLVNALIGCNTEKDFNSCKEKIDCFDNEIYRPEIITDVSLYSNSNVSTIWEYALRKEKFIVCTVPVYSVPDKNCITENDLLNVIKKQIFSGVKIITIHPTITRELIEKSKSRITPCTSRGGGIILNDFLKNNRKQNVYLSCLDDIISICQSNDVAISIGAAFRPANIIDALDDVQLLELQKQLEIANRITAQGGKVILEMPGHIDLVKLEKLSELMQDIDYPVMPLGPVVTEIGEGYDHIVSAIGLSHMGIKGHVQIISAMTAEEHTGGIPSIESTKEAIITAKIVAHIIDLYLLKNNSIDREIAISRKKSCLKYGKEGCARCGEVCPLLLDLN